MADFNYLSVDVRTGLLGVTVFLLTKWILQRGQSRAKYPPGPRGIPYLGNGLALWNNEKAHLLLHDWAKTHGEVYTLRLGHSTMVVLNSKEAIRELFIEKGDVTSYRPRLAMHHLFSGSRKGIIGNMGEPWKQQRRAALTSLRDFGVGKATLEERILTEAEYVSDVMQKNAGTPVSVDELFINFSMDVINSVVFGSRLDYEDPYFVYLRGEIRYLFAQGGMRNMSLFYPEVLVFMPIMCPVIFFAIRKLLKLKRYILSRVAEHEETFDPDNIRDFVDLYIKSKQDGEAEDQTFETIFHIFVTGTETTSAALNWCILFLINHPEVQEKCREEISKVIGTSRQVRYQDRSVLHYVQATVHETLRLGNIAPVNLPHATSAEVKFRDYVFPKDTLILANLYTVHLDPDNFEDPLAFKPERWLDSKGEFHTDSSYMPFGLGPRECLGKSLAYQEFFLLIVTLLQRFRFHPEDPQNLPKEVGVLGISYQPDPFKVNVERI